MFSIIDFYGETELFDEKRLRASLAANPKLTLNGFDETEQSLDSWLHEAPENLQWEYNTAFLAKNKDSLSQAECLALMYSPHWDGSINVNWGVFEDSPDFIEEVLTCPKWDGDPSALYESLESKDFILRLVKTPTWDGYLDHMDPEVLEDPEVLDAIFSSERWSGDIDFYNLEGRTFEQYKKMVLQSNWNGDVSVLPFDWRNSKELGLLILQSPNWDGNMYGFGATLLDDPSFMEKLRKSSRWNGSESFFASQMSSSLQFCYTVMVKVGYQGSIEEFGRALKDKDFFQEIESRYDEECQ